jgi:signal peptidase I
MENLDQDITSTPDSERSKLGQLIDWSNSWTGTIIIVLFIISFVAQAFVIPSGSMKNTLLIGDNLFVKKFSYGVPTPHIPWLEIPIIPGVGKKLIDGAKPQRSDIVVFRYPDNTKTHFVKRCVAVGGDKLFMQNKDLYIKPFEGEEYIKNNFAPSTYVRIAGELWVKNPYRTTHLGIHNDSTIQLTNPAYPEAIFNFSPIKVKKDHYFMMGDNRDHSNDSRFWGSVPYELIEGTPWFIYFSVDENYEIRWDRMFRTIDSLEKIKG